MHHKVPTAVDCSANQPRLRPSVEEVFSEALRLHPEGFSEVLRLLREGSSEAHHLNPKELFLENHQLKLLAQATTLVFSGNPQPEVLPLWLLGEHRRSHPRKGSEFKQLPLGLEVHSVPQTLDVRPSSEDRAPLRTRHPSSALQSPVFQSFQTLRSTHRKTRQAFRTQTQPQQAQTPLKQATSSCTLR